MGIISPILKPQISAPPSNPALLTGLISCYEMDETSGSTIYDSHGSNDFTVYSGLLNQAGKIGTGIKFNGTSAYAIKNTNDNNLSPSAAQSISAWVYKHGDSINDPDGSIISKYYSATGYRVYDFYIFNSTNATYHNIIGFNYYDSANVVTTIAYTPPSDIWLNTWNHVVVTRSGALLNLYVNGVKVATASGGNGSLKQQSVTVRDTIAAVNKSTTMPDNYLFATIDQLAIWGVELTQQQVTDLYNNGAGVPYVNWV